MINYVNSTHLIEHRRIPTRPPELQNEHFIKNFDYTTLFYDCFRTNENEVMLIGPALFNLRELLDNSQFYDGETILRFKTKQFKRVTRIK